MEPALQEPTPLGLSLRTALTMTAFTIVFTGLMAGTYEATHETIAESVQVEKLRLINEVLPPRSYDNELLQDFITLPLAPELGLPTGGQIWRARKDGKPVALVMEAVAPDGYSGNIRMVIAIMNDGRLSGVRVIEHRETPGLGDYIDQNKDKDKANPWILQFSALDPAKTPISRWAVRKDGGEISYRAGATISPRAVANAVARAATFAIANHDRLYAQGAQP